MMKRLMTGMGIFGIALALIASPALAFRCPTLIKQADDAMAAMRADDTKLKEAKKLTAEAQRLHDGGRHAESVKKAEEALALLGVKAPARRGYSY